jgi:hypothetical protein
VCVAQVLLIELSLRHRQMVRLMHRTADQEAEKRKSATVLDLLRVGRRDGEKLTIRQRSSFRAPPPMAVHGLRPGGDHLLDRDEGAPGAVDGDL